MAKNKPNQPLEVSGAAVTPPGEVVVSSDQISEIVSQKKAAKTQEAAPPPPEAPTEKQPGRRGRPPKADKAQAEPKQEETPKAEKAAKAPKDTEKKAAVRKLPDSRYAALDAQYAKEQDELNSEIADIETAITGFEESKKSAEKFIALIDKYENFDTLTNTMLNELVEKILIHERDRKGSQDTTQEVEIYFTFVGRYIPPHFGEVALTAEEQEELRKKEERKDRLHENYMRRKANGKYREYEERTKAAKKAEMGAKRAAIRAEDMTRGVNIPIGNLPLREPQIAINQPQAATL